METTLIQPRSPWGKHPYLPNGLLAVAARLDAGNIAWQLVDENLGHRLDHKTLGKPRAFGIGCLGPPYVTEVLRVGHHLRLLGYKEPILIGGEFVKRLSDGEFRAIFGSLGDIVNAGEECALDALVGQSPPSIFDLSMGSVLHELPPEMLSTYFRKEWCLFTSQGCVFNCAFCAASKGMSERFRDMDRLQDEVAAIAPLVRRFAGREPAYEVYLSTLEGFQNPEKMEQVLEIVYTGMRREGVKLNLRFLATAVCTAKAERQSPGIIERFREFGVTSVGLGVDGDDEVTWKEQNKRHNNAKVIAEALDLLKTRGIQPETFMVIGFPGDAPRAILKGALASFRYAHQGMRVRPYLGKSGMPGTKPWKDDRKLRANLLNDPRLFREFEYAGLGSPMTHPNTPTRILGNAVFLGTCLALKTTQAGCPTQPLLPTESVSRTRKVVGHIWNRLMPQDR